MTTSHLRGKVCCDISWVVLTQSLVIWWKKMERGQATVGDCCARASFPSAFPVHSYACANPLLIIRFDLRFFCGGLKDTDPLASCASPAFTSKQTSNASSDQPKRRLPWQMEFIILTILPQRKPPLCQVTQAICPDSLTNPNTLLMGTGTPWCCYRGGCLLSAKSQRNTLRDFGNPSGLKEPKIPDLVRTSVWRTILKQFFTIATTPRPLTGTAKHWPRAEHQLHAADAGDRVQSHWFEV